MKIGIIGSGGMGIVLATKFIELGHNVSIANSRGSASLKEIADVTGAVASSVEDINLNTLERKIK